MRDISIGPDCDLKPALRLMTSEDISGETADTLMAFSVQAPTCI